MRTVILGGGISGLSAAWFLSQKDPKRHIILLEQNKRLGGFIETRKEGSFSFEMGPRTLSFSRSPHLLRLIETLGLSSRIIYSSPAAKRRFLYKKGKLRSLSSFWPVFLGAILRDFFYREKQRVLEDESIDSFISRRLGAKIAKDFFDPLTLGIYAGDIKRLSIRSCFPFLYRWAQEEGSLLKGFWKAKKGSHSLFTLEGGLETLILEMQKQLPIEIVRECQVKSLSSQIVTSQGVFEADQIISALPCYELSKITQIACEIPYRSIWVVQLGFTKKVLNQRGFGYLVPTQEKESLLGMVWDSEIFFAAESQTRLTAMIREESCHPVEDALDALRRHLSISLQPDYVSCYLAKQAIAQFEVGHQKKIKIFEEEISSRFPNLWLAGNYLTGPSLEDCVARSFEVVSKMK